jgi:hypothetical protein
VFNVTLVSKRATTKAMKYISIVHPADLVVVIVAILKLGRVKATALCTIVRSKVRALIHRKIFLFRLSEDYEQS